MPGYNRGQLSAEAYAVRILAAVVKKSGGTLRVKGEDVDGIADDVFLSKTWCSETQEVVLSLTLGKFNEVWKITAEKAPAKENIEAPAVQAPAQEPTRSVSTLDSDHLIKLEESLRRRSIARMIHDMRKGQPQP